MIYIMNSLRNYFFYNFNNCKNKYLKSVTMKKFLFLQAMNYNMINYSTNFFVNLFRIINHVCKNYFQKGNLIKSNYKMYNNKFK